jgi:hypothetical protein
MTVLLQPIITEQNFKLKFSSQGSLVRKSYFKIWPPNKNTYLRLHIIFHSITTGQDILRNRVFLAVILFRNSFGEENGNVSKSVLILEKIQTGDTLTTSIPICLMILYNCRI